MKNTLALAMLVCLPYIARAQATTKVEQSCGKVARQALLSNSHRIPENTDTDASYVFFNGAMVGDAGMSIEIDVYQNKTSGAFYKVELDGEMCTLRSIEQISP